MNLIDKCLYDVLRNTAHVYQEKTAIKFYADSLSWNELLEQVDKTARILQYIGVKKGDHVGIWSVNSIEWIITFFAIAKCGAISVMINPNSQRHEIKNLMNYANIDHLMIGDTFKNVNPSKICERLGEDEEFDCAVLKSIYSIGKQMIGYQNLFDTVVPDDFVEENIKTDCQDTACMLFTSGTTSTPKGVMLSHYNLVNNSLGIKECLGLNEDDKFCMIVPLYHCFGISGGILACTHAGAEIDMIRYFRVDEASQVLAENQCTAVSGVPTMLIALSDHAEINRITYPMLKKGEVAGAICTRKTFQRITKYLFEELMVSYGQTEASPSVTFSKPGDSIEIRSRTVGTAMEHVQLQIVDPDSKKVLSQGETGEIAIKGYNVMQGYYHMPELTKQTISEDGWLYSGDIGYLDENAYVHLIGRSKEMIIRGGENISPYEIEEVILSLAEISQVKVIGVADAKYQEEICACIILKEGESLNKEEILEYTSKELSFFKQPKYVVFLDEFPLTSSGKVQVPKLRSIAMQKLNIDPASCGI